MVDVFRQVTTEVRFFVNEEMEEVTSQSAGEFQGRCLRIGRPLRPAMEPVAGCSQI